VVRRRPVTEPEIRDFESKDGAQAK
jgi:hypothetical protein